MTPPDFDRKPLYTDGVGIGWVGYGIFDEWPSACFWIVVWNDDAIEASKREMSGEDYARA